jgi:aminoglycoside N3'-acetyltransferase
MNTVREHHELKESCVPIMRNQPIVTRSQLVRNLGELGVSAGQTVMLHASVRNIGWIVGGPDVVLDAILAVLTPVGTLMMIASWEDNPYELEQWPRERQEAYLRECPSFKTADVCGWTSRSTIRSGVLWVGRTITSRR